MAYFPVCEVLVKDNHNGSGVVSDEADRIGSIGGSPDVVGHAGSGNG